MQRSVIPRVSVIIPTYNMAQYVGIAVRSVLAQSFADFEIIVVDDGSTDMTRSEIAKISDPRIRYIYNKSNSGLGAARNTGIRAARGDYIALLDADDMWFPSFLERTTSVLDSSSHVGAVYTGYQYMDAGGNPLPTQVCKVVDPHVFHLELWRGNWLSPCAVVARLQCYREVGLFDEDRRIGGVADYDMWLRMSERYEFVGIPEVLVWYRRSGNNMSDDVDYMTGALELVLTKHLGSLNNPFETWSECKKEAVCRLYIHRALGYAAQQRFEESAENIRWLISHHPPSVISLDFWYAIACAHQMVGQRGEFATWDQVRGEQDVCTALAAIARTGVPYGIVSRISGYAHYALAKLNYGKGFIQAAREHMLQSIVSSPGLVVTPGFVNLAIRLLPGATWLRRWYVKLTRGL
jgi:glycosyltransferase involved in cell wall biosynthesis